MAADLSDYSFRLSACHELIEAYPDSLRIREQVEALEEAMPDRPGVVISFCKTIIETTCKTILTDHGIEVDSRWEAPRLTSESLKYLNLGLTGSGVVDAKLRNAADSLVRGLNQITNGLVEIRNSYGSAAHGADAYAPLLDASYAEIMARATDAVVGLLFRTHVQSGTSDPLARFRYGAHPDFDERVDNDYGPFEVLEVPLIASEALYRTDFEAYRALLVQFKQDQQGDQGAAVEGDQGAAVEGDQGAAVEGDQGAAVEGDQGVAAQGQLLEGA